MQTSDLARARAAAVSVASSLGLPCDDAVVLFRSNRVTLRLTPCDVLARVTDAGHELARLELERARRLADAGCPVGLPEPQVPERVHERDGFAVTLWVYHDQASHPVRTEAYAGALARLHAMMRRADLTGPRFTDRIAEAHQVATDPDLSPDLAEADRALLAGRLADLRQTIERFGAPEQLLHGEPHPGNVLGTRNGPVFIDLETICRGPVELDLAHVPEAVAAHYPGADHELLGVCRALVLAIIAAWRWKVGDGFPDRDWWRHALLRALRDGPLWPSLDTLTRQRSGAPDRQHQED